MIIIKAARQSPNLPFLPSPQSSVENLIHKKYGAMILVLTWALLASRQEAAVCRISESLELVEILTVGRLTP